MAIENEKIEVNSLNSSIFESDIDNLNAELYDNLIKTKKNVYISKIIA